MSDTVYIYDTVSDKWWLSSGRGYTAFQEEAHPWPRDVAESIVGGCEWIEIREIEPEEIVI